MSASPPTPDSEPWAADYVSTNGATSNLVRERVRRIVVLAYITAFALPPVGLILGVMLATRPAKTRSRHWIGIIVLSIVGAAVWILVFGSGALTTTSNELT
jgi:putative Mn2+ efflux pump MntP